MSGIGDTLRAARLRRGDDLAVCATATGIGPTFLQLLEEGRFDELPPTAHADDLLLRYATHLGIDAGRLHRAGSVDGDADTQPIPVIAPRPRTRDSTLLWLGAGGLLGLGGVILLGGGLGSGDPPTVSPTSAGARATPRTATDATPRPTPAPPSSTALRPAPPTTPAIELRLGARAGKTVWVEVRRRDVRGPQLFAGIVGAGATRVIRSSTPLWLGVAWAPNVTVAVNDEVIDVDGGTEAYRVTERGLTKLPTS